MEIYTTTNLEGKQNSTLDVPPSPQHILYFARALGTERRNEHCTAFITVPPLSIKLSSRRGVFRVSRRGRKRRRVCWLGPVHRRVGGIANRYPLGTARSNAVDDENDPASQFADTGNDEAGDGAIVLTVFVMKPMVMMEIGNHFEIRRLGGRVVVNTGGCIVGWSRWFCIIEGFGREIRRPQTRKASKATCDGNYCMGSAAPVCFKNDFPRSWTCASVHISKDDIKVLMELLRSCGRSCILLLRQSGATPGWQTWSKI
ncbi:hypothetical protein BJX63DRAFT_318226 [Aspergillus granulosus]|uniref:Uncharacterized protein n=1 Tax=Aspergillus granulosus TaxID=176169 RepID=A0ABR4H4I4_9EURO